MRPAPAVSWLIALAMALVPVLFFVRWIQTPGVLGDVPLIEHMRLRIDEFLSEPPGQRDRMHGVMLTASGGLCAVSGDRQLPEDGPELLVLAFPRATFDDFYPLVDQLVARRPDFIVIQSSVLTLSGWLRREKTFPFDHEYSLFTGTLIFWARQALMWNAFETYPVVTAERYCGDKRMAASNWMRQEAALAESTEGQFDGPAQDRLFHALDILDNAGIPVMVVGAPRYDASAAYGESLMSRSRALVSSAPRSLTRITFHTFPGLLPETLFQDPLHVAPSVRPRYRAWLAAEIRNTLPRP